MPGVILAAVGFDNVTISRGGAMEQMFIDQSQPAAGAAGGAAPQVVAPVATPPSPAAPVITVPTPAPAGNQLLTPQGPRN